MTVPVSAFDESKFKAGHAFDGSSIAGWKGIQASDMLLMPDPATAYIDPFFDEVSVVLTCDVVEPTGGRWLRALSLPILFLLFGLPIWSAIIDTYTNPLQIISTDISYSMLQLVGFDPYKQDNTTIYLKNFTLDVGVPCSGLKLAIAVSAFTSFFMMIAKLKWWGNLIMVAAVLPLCLFINGLRITLIGVVGNIWGDKRATIFTTTQVISP